MDVWLPMAGTSLPDIHRGGFQGGVKSGKRVERGRVLSFCTTYKPGSLLY